MNSKSRVGVDDRPLPPLAPGMNPAKPDWIMPLSADSWEAINGTDVLVNRHFRPVERETSGLMQAHVDRAKQGGMHTPSPWHTHHVLAHFVYVLRGESTMEFDGIGKVVLGQDTALFLPTRTRHRLLAMTDETEVLEVKVPGTFHSTFVVYDEPAGEWRNIEMHSLEDLPMIPMEILGGAAGDADLDRPLPPREADMNVVEPQHVMRLGPESWQAVRGTDMLVCRHLSAVEEATGGLMQAHVDRANPGGSRAASSWHTHHVAAHFTYVLRGAADFEFDGIGKVHVEADTAVFQAAQTRHRLLSMSDDYEALEVKTPGTFRSTFIYFDDEAGEWKQELMRGLDDLPDMPLTGASTDG